MPDLLNKFKATLDQIVINDTNYNVRQRLILEAMGMAEQLGFETSVYIDEKVGPEYPVFAI